MENTQKALFFSVNYVLYGYHTISMSPGIVSSEEFALCEKDSFTDTNIKTSSFF